MKSFKTKSELMQHILDRLKTHAIKELNLEESKQIRFKYDGITYQVGFNGSVEEVDHPVLSTNDNSRKMEAFLHLQ